jgi:hypothetical protein
MPRIPAQAVALPKVYGLCRQEFLTATAYIRRSERKGFKRSQILMSIIHPPFRRATIQDAGTLAQFVEFASEGLALYLWTKLAGARHNPWHIGRERVGSETGGLSYRNGVIAELAGRPVSGLISYPLADKPEPISANLPGVHCTNL